MKRILKHSISILLVGALLASVLTSFTGCDFISGIFGSIFGYSLKGVDAERGRDAFISQVGGVSETYKGGVSEESYNNAEDAATAFVTNEIVGEKYATIDNVENRGELSDFEISSLNLPDDISLGMVGVEMLEVDYSTEEYYEGAAEDGVFLSDTLNKNHKVTVYVIKYDDGWKYYTPCPVTGETITKNYYDSVFDYEKYKNCTLESRTSTTVDMSVLLQNGNFTIDIIQLIKHADNKVYLEQTISVTANGLYEGMENEIMGAYQEKLYAYMEEDEYGYVTCYIKQGQDSTEWFKGDLYTIGFSSLEELTPFYDQYLDYSYFTKTDFGFTLQDENAKQYLKESLSDLLDMLESDDWEFDMYSEYYVSDGVLSGLRSDVEIAMNADVSGQKLSMYETLQQEVICRDYGTTVIEKPFED